MANKLIEYNEAGGTGMSVNFPNIQPGALTDRRVVHLHQNVPGVMARLNSILAKYDINIGAQMLATEGMFGYSITDASAGDFDAVLAELQNMDETVRVRVLGKG